MERESFRLDDEKLPGCLTGTVWASAGCIDGRRLSWSLVDSQMNEK
jgi:hypothetical protein